MERRLTNRDRANIARSVQAQLWAHKLAEERRRKELYGDD